MENLTKREYFAGQIIARWNGARPYRHDTLGGRAPYNESLKMRLEDDAKLAVAASDALIAALEAGPIQWVPSSDGFEHTRLNALIRIGEAEAELEELGENPPAERAEYLQVQITDAVRWLKKIDEMRASIKAKRQQR